MKIDDYGHITLILRDLDYQTVKLVCKVLEKSKYIKNVEITLNSQGALSIIDRISKEFKGTLHIGAGTVTTLKAAIEAVECGAEFLLSPIVLDRNIIEYANSQGVLTVSGAYTPSEIYKAYENGCNIVKVFPVTSLKDTYFKDVKAPLGRIPMMAVGGVNRDNGKIFLSQGADYLGLGVKGIFSQKALQSQDISQLEKECEIFEEFVLG